MPRKIDPLDTKHFLRLIPPEARNDVARWLRSCADKAEDTARRMLAANRTIGDPATHASAQHWLEMAACAKLYAHQVAVAIPDHLQPRGGHKDVGSKS